MKSDESLQQFFDEVIVTAQNAIAGQPPSDYEYRAAKFIADKIFGKTRDESARVSHLNQGLAVVRIRYVAEAFASNWFSVKELVGVLERCALLILHEHGVDDYPYQLPPEHHPLAQTALKMLIETDTLLSLLRADDYQGNRSQVVRISWRLMSVIELMEKQWFVRDLIRGQKHLDVLRAAHVTVHGTDREKRNRWAAMTSRWQEIAVEQPRLKRASVDAAVGAEFNVSPKTVLRARTKYAPRET